MTEYQFWVRVIRMAAAVIGASLALWWLSGDRDPEARGLGATSDYSQTILIGHRDVYDRDGVFFFLLSFPDGGQVVVSADDDLALAQYLIHHAGQRVQLVLRDLPGTTGQAAPRKDGSQ